MNEHSRGIVLQHIRYGDTSLIVKILTENHGMVSFLVKGAFGKHSRFKPAFFQPLTLLEFVSNMKPGRELQFMTEVSVEIPFHSLHNEMQKNSIVIFISELLSKTSLENNPNSLLFAFVHQSIQWLDLQDRRFADFHLHFMVELSRHLGFYPKSDHYSPGDVFDLMDGLFKPMHPSVFHAIPSGLSTQFHELCQTPLDALWKLHLSREQRRGLLDHLIIYYRLHLPGFKGLQSHEVLSVVLG